MFDLIIIGGGPAGLTAAIYAKRAGKKVLIIEKDSFGGQIALSPRVDNYPGITSISGMELAESFTRQIELFDIERINDQVIAVAKSNDLFQVSTKINSWLSKAIIIAVGVKHRPLGIEGEEELVGNGISYCALCDGAFYEGLEVAVIGGGNSAVQEAILLAAICSKVHLVTIDSQLTAEEILINRLKENINIEFHFNYQVKSINKDENGVSSVNLISLKGEPVVINAKSLFVAIGMIPENKLFSNFVDLDSFGYIITDIDCQTRSPGVFSAGDCRKKTVRQLTTAVSDGTIAAIAALKFINQNF